METQRKYPISSPTRRKRRTQLVLVVTTIISLSCVAILTLLHEKPKRDNSTTLRNTQNDPDQITQKNIPINSPQEYKTSTPSGSSPLQTSKGHSKLKAGNIHNSDENITIIKPSSEAQPPQEIPSETSPELTKMINQLSELKERWRQLAEEEPVDREEEIESAITTLVADFFELDLLLFELDKTLISTTEKTQIENHFTHIIQNMKQAGIVNERFMKPDDVETILEYLWKFTAWLDDYFEIDLTSIAQGPISTDPQISATALEKSETEMNQRISELSIYLVDSEEAYPSDFLPHLIWQMSLGERISLATNFTNSAINVIEQATDANNRIYRREWTIDILKRFIFPAIDDKQFNAELSARLNNLDPHNP